MGKLSY